MTRFLRRTVLFFAAAVCLPAAAAAEPHTRTGYCAGVGFGLESVSWTDANGERDVEGSGAGNARMGWAVRPDLVAGVEFWGWAREYDIGTSQGDVPVKVRLIAVNACATYFPGNAGFFIRVGAGLAQGLLRVSPPPSVTTVAAGEETDTGVAVNLAPGYEWRVTTHFALGAQGDIVYLGLQDSLENAFGYGVSAQFNWYW